MTRQQFTDLELADMAATLEAHLDYRVLRRLAPFRLNSSHLPLPAVAAQVAPTASSGTNLLKGIVLDTEATGLRPGSDKIIELAMLAFLFDPLTGQVVDVVAEFSAFEDPGAPIPPESITVHGITDDMVSGKTIDDAAVAAFIDGCSIVIAHNAGFDRNFVERRLPVFADLAWGCSFQQINWAAGGIGSAKLDYIAASMGFFFEAHRALADCHALLAVLAGRMPVTSARPLRELWARAGRRDIRVWARGSSFDNKDLLKERAYRWEANERCWYRDVPYDDLQAELDWLAENIYAGRPAAVALEQFDATVRFSNRRGVMETRRLG